MLRPDRDMMVRIAEIDASRPASVPCRGTDHFDRIHGEGLAIEEVIQSRDIKNQAVSAALLVH